MDSNQYVIEVLNVVKQFQNTYQCFKDTFSNKMPPNDKNDGTIPLMLYHKNGNLVEEVGIDGEESGVGSFTSYFFRVEEIDPTANKAIMTLIKPFDMGSKPTLDLTELYRLEKTFIFIEVKLEHISAVQCISPRLMNRALPIIEPKWES
ncbi:hypothetical protein IMZ08_15330 [Bacillus luteolus]|uniref:Uncharacterized protein n=1 Tax=Litchfieldia luteola TaxID=682179 RepID=A0ABR9QLP1_9BACI|nr:CotY/CotZ family spore coat protein [Cytobacillus luteolus]MBE4909423.1 hypothetical protein [Cytobacillus luteolus]MBP1940823.1 hypothetical protein [Cytobacillus luteolus]